jgi:hypothetical protein
MARMPALARRLTDATIEVFAKVDLDPQHALCALPIAQISYGEHSTVLRGNVE